MEILLNLGGRASVGLWGTGEVVHPFSVWHNGVCESAALAVPLAPAAESSPCLWFPFLSTHLPLPVCTSVSLLKVKCFLLLCLWQVYGSLSAGEFQLIRQTLLTFFQDLHIRVSEWAATGAPCSGCSSSQADTAETAQ